MRKDEKINDILDMDTDEIEEVCMVEIPEDDLSFSENHENDIDEDYKFIRTKIRRTVLACETLLDATVKRISINTSPMVIQSAAAILKVMVESSKELQNIHQKQKTMKNEKKPAGEKEDGVIEATVHEIMDSMESKDK